MLIIKIAVSKDGSFPETYVFCPNCGKQTVFFSVSPKQCRHCCRLFPDVRALKMKYKYRALWHNTLA